MVGWLLVVDTETALLLSFLYSACSTFNIVYKGYSESRIKISYLCFIIIDGVFVQRSCCLCFIIDYCDLL